MTDLFFQLDTNLEIIAELFWLTYYKNHKKCNHIILLTVLLNFDLHPITAKKNSNFLRPLSPLFSQAFVW